MEVTAGIIGDIPKNLLEISLGMINGDFFRFHMAYISGICGIDMKAYYWVTGKDKEES